MDVRNRSILGMVDGVLLWDKDVWVSRASSRAGKGARAPCCSKYLQPCKHFVSIWATLSSLTRSLEGKEMGWFEENEPSFLSILEMLRLVCQIQFCSTWTSGEHHLVVVNGNSQRAETCSTISHSAQTQACELGLSIKLKEQPMSQTLQSYDSEFPVDSSVQNYKTFVFSTSHLWCIQL